MNSTTSTGGGGTGGVIKCRAAVAWAAGEPLAIEEVELSPPGPLGIRIKVVSTSLCRRDFTSWLSEMQMQMPLKTVPTFHLLPPLWSNLKRSRSTLDKGKSVLKLLSRSVVTLTCESAAEGGICDVYLVGTAHVSKESCQEVQAIINFLKPGVLLI